MVWVVSRIRFKVETSLTRSHTSINSWFNPRQRSPRWRGPSPRETASTSAHKAHKYSDCWLRKRKKNSIYRNTAMEAACSPPSPPIQLLEHYSVWLEVLFQLLNNFDTPVNRRVGMINFYFGGSPVNLLNRKVRTSEEWRMIVPRIMPIELIVYY